MSRAQIVGRATRAQLVGAGPGEYDHLYEFTGADPVAPAPSQAYQRSTGGPRVVQKEAHEPREFPIGFNSANLTNGVIAAGATSPIEQKPQVIFRGERLAVPNTIVANFDIQDVKVGKDSQLASPGSMPAECFSNISVGVRMQLDTSEPGITLTLSMTNLDANNPHAFKSVLYGTVME